MLFKKNQKKRGFLRRLGTGQTLALLLLFVVAAFLVFAQLMTVLSTRVTDCSFGFWNLHQLADIDPLELTSRLSEPPRSADALDKALLSMWLDVEIGSCAGPAFTSITPLSATKETIAGTEITIDDEKTRRNAKRVDLLCPPSSDPSFGFTFSSNPRLRFPLTAHQSNDKTERIAGGETSIS